MRQVEEDLVTEKTTLNGRHIIMEEMIRASRHICVGEAWSRVSKAQVTAAPPVQRPGEVEMHV